MLPDLPSHQSQRIAERWLGLAIPGRLPDGQLPLLGVLMRQQRDQREEAQQRWRRAQDRQV